VLLDERSGKGLRKAVSDGHGIGRLR